MPVLRVRFSESYGSHERRSLIKAAASPSNSGEANEADQRSRTQAGTVVVSPNHGSRMRQHEWCRSREFVSSEPQPSMD